MRKIPFDALVVRWVWLKTLQDSPRFVDRKTAATDSPPVATGIVSCLRREAEFTGSESAFIREAAEVFLGVHAAIIAPSAGCKP